MAVLQITRRLLQKVASTEATFIISIHIALKLGLSIPIGFTPYLITFPLTSSPTILSGS